MQRGDLEAIATYLKSLRPNLPEPAHVGQGDPVLAAGGAIYHDRCAACHSDDGTGGTGQTGEAIFPRLAGSAVVQVPDPATLLRIVLWGNRGGATDAAPTAPAMPSFGWTLNDNDVAAVLTFIRNSWGNAAPQVAASAVRSARAEVAVR